MDLLELIEKNAFHYGVKIVVAIIILFVGYQIIKIITHFAANALQKSKVNKSIRPFFLSIISIGLKVLLLLTVAGTLGVKTTSFVAVLASAGLAFGLALQGSLANFAGGILILFFKPFEVDDYIKGQDIEGTVEEIQLFYTQVLKMNGETVYIPNGALSNGNIINYTKKGQLRLSIPFGVAYNADLKVVKSMIEECLKDNHLVMNTPRPEVVVVELADNCVNLEARPWVLPQHKAPAKAQLIESVKYKLDKGGVEIPFPQAVIHLRQ